MKILDCETSDSIYESMEEVSGIKRARLEAVFDACDFYDNESDELEHSHMQRLFSEISKVAGCSLTYDGACWFHLTRAVAGNRFESGLLPLGPALDLMWDFLGSLAVPAVGAASWNSWFFAVSCG
jgi:hypothetical protein